MDDYWREDVSGLYFLRGSDGLPIALIEACIAQADERPAAPMSVRAPKAACWFRAIRHADETTPAPHRFAFCAFPAVYGSRNRYAFIIDETNTIHGKDFGRAVGVDVFPSDPLRDGWQTSW